MAAEPGLAVKICGITRTDDLACAIEHGAAFAGFVFYPPSPRSLAPDAWQALGQSMEIAVPRVGVMVDPEDEWIDAVLAAAPLDFIQLHGHETPERVRAIRQRTGTRIIKSISVSEKADVERHSAYLDCADMLLFDAKPPRTPGAIPGGNGLSFDWRLLAGQSFGLPWLLAGGLDPDNIETAVQRTGARMVDVSSRIELEPGIKNHKEIRRLLTRARALVRGDEGAIEEASHDSH